MDLARELKKLWKMMEIQIAVGGLKKKTREIEDQWVELRLSRPQHCEDQLKYLEVFWRNMLSLRLYLKLVWKLI